MRGVARRGSVAVPVVARARRGLSVHGPARRSDALARARVRGEGSDAHRDDELAAVQRSAEGSPRPADLRAYGREVDGVTDTPSRRGRPACRPRSRVFPTAERLVYSPINYR